MAISEKIIIGKLTLTKIEQHFLELTGIDGAVIRSNYAEIGMDVDKTTDLQVANEYFQSLMKN